MGRRDAPVTAWARRAGAWRLGLAALGLTGLWAAAEAGQTADPISFHPVAMPPPVPSRSNVEIGRDILDLAFRLESGREVVFLSRFDEKVRVGVLGRGPETLERDLAELLHRLRVEAGVDIGLAGTMHANLIVAFIDPAAVRAAVPYAACFVVPGVSSWEEFLNERGSPEQDWARLDVRTSAAVFIPGDVAPQEVRDCLHEEIAQALGPLNDLYRLPDSVFNDDNVRAVLTDFDMLALRVLYSPELSSGMTRAEVVMRLPALLARLNPDGENWHQDAPELPQSWTDAMSAALSRGAPREARRSAAEAAVVLAGAGTAKGLALMALGRAEVTRDPHSAETSFAEALEYFDSQPATAIQAACVRLQLAALALSRANPETAARLAREAQPVARAHGDASLLSILLFVEAEALDMAGETEAASAVRLDGLGWARYGFGEAGSRRRLQEVQALSRAAAEAG